MRAARDGGIRLLGVIENMSGYQCAGCATARPLFAGDAGFQLAQEFAVPLLGHVPFTADGDRPRAGSDSATAVSAVAARLREILA
jgi:ATP-binding protein involved in chromosome partitioning